MVRGKSKCVVILLSLLCFIIAACSQKAEINDEISSVKKLVDATIAIGLQNYLKRSPKGYKLSRRLQKLINDLKLGEVGILMSNKVWVGINPKGVNLLIEDEWTTPFTMSFSGENKLPKIKFKSGEIGLKKGEIYIKEGTMAKVENTTYKVIKGSWQLINGGAK